MAAQPDHTEQQLIAHRQDEPASGADGALAVGTGEADAFGGQRAGQEVGEELIELKRLHTGQVEEDARLAGETVITDGAGGRLTNLLANDDCVYPTHQSAY
ncbi:MAG: hypothetical protein LC748_16170 [Thermomicrobia bacterium]|nr:hypothetical protein [Thermomicrobia bacterium]